MISIRALLPQSVELNWRLYLATYAQHFGASGLTFFDDAVTEFFSPHAAGKKCDVPDRSRQECSTEIVSFGLRPSSAPVTGYRVRKFLSGLI
jgi:hypothetical protein